MKWNQDYKSKRFAIIPMEMMLDKRFKFRHFSAISAIALHADNDGTARVSLETLCEITGNDGIGNMSNTIKELIKFGYILSRKQDGFNGPNIYRLAVPDYDEGSEVLREVSSKMTEAADYEKVKEENKEKGKAYAKKGREAKKEASKVVKDIEEDLKKCGSIYGEYLAEPKAVEAREALKKETAPNPLPLEIVEQAKAAESVEEETKKETHKATTEEGETIELTEEEALKAWAIFLKYGENTGFNPEYFKKWGLDRQKMKKFWNMV